MRKYKLQKHLWDVNCSPTEQLVLQALAYHYNQETEQCNPSYARLASMTGLAVRTVAKAVKSLRDAGVITTERTPATLQCSFVVCMHEVHITHARGACHSDEFGVDKEDLDHSAWNKEFWDAKRTEEDLP